MAREESLISSAKQTYSRADGVRTQAVDFLAQRDKSSAAARRVLDRCEKTVKEVIKVEASLSAQLRSPETSSKTEEMLQRRAELCYMLRRLERKIDRLEDLITDGR